MILKLVILVLTFGTTIIHADVEGHSFIACSTRPCERSSTLRPNPRTTASEQSISVTSTNWSGYVAAPNLTTSEAYSVSSVSGSWIVPGLHAMGSDTWCSIWVGIDGSGSTTVEQIGTEHDIKNGLASHYAWYEMFPLGSQEIVGFPVEEGDHISALVTYIPLVGLLQPNSDLFILQIFNNTKKLYTSIPYITSSRMKRVCAEWVVEAPWMNTILPLSNFGTVFLSNCSATIHNVVGSISSPAWKCESMNMVAPSGSLKATTSALAPDGKSFWVTWNSN